MNRMNSRCGFVTIVGLPNSGKSTLLNKLMGTKVSIVSPKVQTTRTRVLGVQVEDNAQIIYIDTPGIFKAKNRLEKAMVNVALQGAGEGDLILLVVDTEKCLNNYSVIEDAINSINISQQKILLVLNKIDLVEKRKILKIIEYIQSKYTFPKIYMVSALDGSGVMDISKDLSLLLPTGPWLFPEDQISDMPLKLLAAEITREKLFHLLNQELPYAVTVETEKWSEKKNNKSQSVQVDIHQTIYVKKDNQKSIVLGKGGQKIKKIGMMARKELENLLDMKINLFLFVKTDKNWENRSQYYSLWGLDS